VILCGARQSVESVSDRAFVTSASVPLVHNRKPSLSFSGLPLIFPDNSLLVERD
jgi:hypothetical protein